MNAKLLKTIFIISVSSILSLCAGCSCEVSDSEKGMLKTLKDLRDGEIIVFNTDTVESFIVNPITGNYYFYYTDTNGAHRVMTKDMEPYIKEIF